MIGDNRNHGGEYPGSDAKKDESCSAAFSDQPYRTIFQKMRTDVAIKQNQMDATVHSAELIHTILTENQRYDCCGLKPRLLEGNTYAHWLLISHTILLTQFLPDGGPDHRLPKEKYCGFLFSSKIKIENFRLDVGGTTFVVV